TFKWKVQQIPTKGDTTTGSYLISLPKIWCEDNDISKGSEIELEEIGSSRILLSKADASKISQKRKSITIRYEKILGANSRTPRAVLGAYLEGFEIINIVKIPDNSKEKLAIRKLIRRLMKKLYGSRIIELKGSVRIEISTELTSPDVLLETIFNKVNMMFQNAILAYTEDDQDLAEDLIELDDEVDALYFQIVRGLKILLGDPLEAIKADSSFELIDTLDYRMIASILENLGDSAERIAAVIQADPNQLDDSDKAVLLSISNQVSKLLENSFRYFMTKDSTNTMNNIVETMTVREAIKELFHTNVDKEIIKILENATDNVIDIGELVRAEFVIE
ncbi:MAG: phosphate uptake regulator PhoU, partial [Candidatus Heimdallarchaeota archaeon]|nr:phosphate uptake regulator PhoU [Candidatus Heimdallarchaeota archaeon]